MTTNDRTDRDRQRLIDAQRRGGGATLFAYLRLSGPGWLQSAITLGGGSLASSLYLGVVAGVAFLWVQPLAMILGIIMLSGIAYVTLSTDERPFAAINRHVNPVLGWSWALAALAANMFWCLPQYGLATGVLEQNLLPEYLGPDGVIVQQAGATFGPGTWLAANSAKLLIVTAILIATTAITWCYDSGRWGIKIYELVLKLMVAGIVACFFAVIYKLHMSGDLDWGGIAWGFVPDLRKLWEPSDEFLAVIKGSKHFDYWSATIVSEQRDMMISAAATAVGINMTFLFPYSLLARGWSKEFRGLARFDLATGMLIPFVLATSCVVIAAAGSFHTREVAGFVNEDGTPDTTATPDAAALKRYRELLSDVVALEMGREAYDQALSLEERVGGMIASLPPTSRNAVSDESRALLGEDLEQHFINENINNLPAQDRRVAAMLIRRGPFDLAKALSPVTGDEVGNLIFGLGVLGMTLSTITLLMLISGFVVCEIFNLPQGGWAHRLGCLAAVTGALGPFIWSRASFYLAVYVSVFGMMLLPLAYLSFFSLMNSRKLLGSEMPSGGRRLAWNILMFIATGVATAASVYSVWKRAGENGIFAILGLIGLTLIVAVFRSLKQRSETR